jgi:hypothetical protein
MRGESQCRAKIHTAKQRSTSLVEPSRASDGGGCRACATSSTATEPSPWRAAAKPFGQLVGELHGWKDFVEATLAEALVAALEAAP